MESVEGACGKEISNYCGNVTRGEGRLVLCMQAHEDRLGLRCQFALYRASRKLEGVINRVEQIADACWSDIEAQCGNADSIGRCVMEKRESLSQPCRTVMSKLREATLGLASLRGLPVTTSDAKDVGQVVDVVRKPDGSVQSIQIEVGQRLGLGAKTITIDADKIDQFMDQVRLRMGHDEVMSAPAASTPGAPSPAAPKK
jgi:sporulation protein YlmC with PRC-barrel domain